jgi:hypothetical protein
MANEQNLKPFKKGTDERRNMNGRPKGVPHSTTRLRRLLELTENLKNPVTGEIEGFTIAEQMDLQQIIKARKGDTRAYNALLDRLEGKPMQSTDITSGGKPLPTVIIGEEYAKDPQFRVDSPAETDELATDSSE